MSADDRRCPWCAEDLYGSSEETILANGRPSFPDQDGRRSGLRSLYHPWCWREYEATLPARSAD